MKAPNNPTAIDRIVVTGTSSNDLRGLGILSAFLVACAFGFTLLPDGGPMLGAGVLLLSLVVVAPIAWTLQRTLGRGAVLDDEGIGPAMHDERLWTLPWDAYGGYRPSTASAWQQARNPELAGFEILDREGTPVVILPIKGSAALAELDLRVPENGFPYDRYRPINPSPKKAAAFMLLGIAMSLLGVQAGPMSKLYVLAPVGILLAVGGLTSTALALGQLFRKTPAALPPAIPEEGPVLERHLFRHALKPISLVEGHRYRTVDPERRRAELRRMLHDAKAFERFTLIFPLIGLIALILRPYQWPAVLPILAILSIFCLVSRLVSASPKTLLNQIDDVLWVHDGELIVIRPNRETIRFPLPKNSDRQALMNLQNKRATDVLRAKTGERYYLDRTRLYSAPTELN